MRVLKVQVIIAPDFIILLYSGPSVIFPSPGSALEQQDGALEIPDPSPPSLKLPPGELSTR